MKLAAIGQSPNPSPVRYLNAEGTTVLHLHRNESPSEPVMLSVRGTPVREAGRWICSGMGTTDQAFRVACRRTE